MTQQRWEIAISSNLIFSSTKTNWKWKFQITFSMFFRFKQVLPIWKRGIKKAADILISFELTNPQTGSIMNDLKSAGF